MMSININQFQQNLNQNNVNLCKGVLMLKLSQTVSYIFVALLLSACGGGGGGSTTTGGTVTTPSMSITSSMSTGAVGTPMTLAWTGANVSNCVASGSWSGNLAATGTQSLTPALGANTYTVTCNTTTASVAVNALPQYTSIPDANFEAALVAMGIDNVVDGQVRTSNLLNVTQLSLLDSNYTPPEGGLTYVPGSNYVTDMSGIENFVNLKTLRLETQKFSSIDVTKLVNLDKLYLWKEPITVINLSKNLKLTGLGLSETSMTTVDTSMLTELTEIDFQQNEANTKPYTLPNGTVVSGFSSLDLTKNSKLLRVYVYGNGLSTLDLTGNKLLQEFWANHNSFTSFDFTGFTNLSTIILNNNNLNYLNITGVANGVAPYRLYAEQNPNLAQIHVGSASIIADLNTKRAAGNQGVFTNTAPLQVTNFVTP
jgi:hypothetical protein